MRSDKQIINGKEIRFCPYFYGIKDRGTISKDNLKKYLFDNFDNEIKYIKVHARVDKNNHTSESMISLLRDIIDV